MRWQVRAEEWEAVNDLLGAARRQARQARRSAVRAATRVCETAAGGGRPLARNALSGAAHSLSGSIRPHDKSADERQILEAKPISRGTESSNPVPSSGESTNFRFRAGLPTLGSDRQQPSAFSLVPYSRRATCGRGRPLWSFRPKLISASPHYPPLLVLPAPKPIGEAL
jgi:hypothetical protein